MTPHSANCMHFGKATNRNGFLGELLHSHVIADPSMSGPAAVKTLKSNRNLSAATMPNVSSVSVAPRHPRPSSSATLHIAFASRVGSVMMSPSSVKPSHHMAGTAP